MPFTPDPYFKSDPRRWTPELFGAACLGKTPDYSLQRILDGYVKSLTKISLDQRTTERRRKKAEHLVEQYRENDEVRDILKTLWTAGQATPPVVINNSTVGLLNTGSLENNGSLGVEMRKRPSDSTSEGADGDNDNEVADGDSAQARKKRPRTTSPRESFIRKYEAMDDSSMWKLSTGKVVEKCIYESVIGSSAAEGLAHMWVISSKDPWMKDLFTIEELEEIHSERILQKATESTQSCWDLLSKFKNVTTIEGLEAILFGAVPEMGQHTEWVYNVMRQMRILLKHPNSPLTSEHGENWYEVNVWGPIIDHLFLLASENLEVDRKEVACSATTLKLNEGRTRTGKGHYLASGKRSDAIIRATDSQNALEYGAIEAKPFFAGETSTAFLDDYDKLTTTLGYMMARLVKSVGKPDDAAKLEVVGVVLAGLHYQSVRMWTRNGNVYVARPDALYCIPTNVRRLKDIVPLLFSVWQMMKTIGACLEVVDATDRYGDMAPEDFL